VGVAPEMSSPSNTSGSSRVLSMKICKFSEPIPEYL
jgi:hypothetical protein